MARSKILEDVRDTLRLRHYSYRTEKSSVHWIRKFILFHKKRHPAEMGKDEIRNFLTFLARQTKVSASTQNQALSVLLFLYKQVLQEEIGYIDQLNGLKSQSVFRSFSPRLRQSKFLLNLMASTGWLLRSCMAPGWEC